LNTDYADDTDSHGFFIFCFIRVNPPNPYHPRSKSSKRKDEEHEERDVFHFLLSFAD